MKVTLLGTGTSTGIPMIGCGCRTCRSLDPCDKRLRVSVLVETHGKTILIDTSADFREQMLRNNVEQIDAILYTHHHYDHIAGFDDLRAFQFLGRPIPTAFANQQTFEHIRKTFAYAFPASEDRIRNSSPERKASIPSVSFQIIDEAPFEAAGVLVTPIPLLHGRLQILGYRIGDFAYLTDCSQVPDSSLALLHGLDTLVLDGLRYNRHPTHLSIDESIEAARTIGANQTYLTHMSHDVLHAEASSRLPAGIALGYDQLVITMGG